MPAAAVALLVFLGFELAAMWLCAAVDPLWAYWHPVAGARFEAFHAASASEGVPDVLIVGDSTAESNFDSDQLAKDATRPTAWNLGMSGNLPLAFRATTMPVLRNLDPAPAMVIASFMPTGFLDLSPVRAMEDRIVSSYECRRTQGRSRGLDRFSLTHAWAALRVWNASRDGSLGRVRDARGFLTRDSVYDAGTRTGRLVQDAETRVAGVPQPDRLAVIEDLAAWARDRRVRLVVCIPPTRDRSESRTTIDRELALALGALADRFGFALFIPEDEKPFDDTEFADRNHLNTRGAARATRMLMDRAALIPSLKSRDARWAP
ncbi:MAG: hypothetical protein FJY92_02100 [Candidatus Hydrogenedentes bacterium]|nr:hypothetical protein [Candidatus Hydrogenedentota bacterium]